MPIARTTSPPLPDLVTDQGQFLCPMRLIRCAHPLSSLINLGIQNPRKKEGKIGGIREPKFRYVDSERQEAGLFVINKHLTHHLCSGQGSVLLFLVYSTYSNIVKPYSNQIA